jgi:exonuclease 3'-5' domain-containing protein 1
VHQGLVNAHPGPALELPVGLIGDNLAYCDSRTRTDLCRSGELLLAQIAGPTGPVILIDILQLGQSAFDEGGLRALLESTSVTKLVFDGRSDADALFHLHGVRLANVCDCQVLCAFHHDHVRAGGDSRAAPSADRLPSLGKALSSCPGLAGGDGAALGVLKKAVQPLFVPEQGGSYEVWRERPLRQSLIEYAAADVAHLHTLRASWGGVVSDATMAAITQRRIERAITAEAPAKGPHMGQRDF